MASSEAILLGARSSQLFFSQATLCAVRRHNNLQVASESEGEECCEDIETVPERPAPRSACQNASRARAQRSSPGDPLSHCFHGSPGKDPGTRAPEGRGRTRLRGCCCGRCAAGTTLPPRAPPHRSEPPPPPPAAPPARLARASTAPRLRAGARRARQERAPC